MRSHVTFPGALPGVGPRRPALGIDSVLPGVINYTSLTAILLLLLLVVLLVRFIIDLGDLESHLIW